MCFQYKNVHDRYSETINQDLLHKFLIYIYNVNILYKIFITLCLYCTTALGLILSSNAESDINNL